MSWLRRTADLRAPMFPRRPSVDHAIITAVHDAMFPAFPESHSPSSSKSPENVLIHSSFACRRRGSRRGPERRFRTIDEKTDTLSAIAGGPFGTGTGDLAILK